MNRNQHAPTAPWRGAVALTAVAVAGLALAQGAARPPGTTVAVQVQQDLAFEPAHVTVTLETPGQQIEGQPRIRPFYGRATLMPNTLTATGFAFRWDVPGALRAARGTLRRTKIYVHWTMRHTRARQIERTPMLTVITVTLSATGRVAVADVTTSGPRDVPVLQPTTTRPAPAAAATGPVSSAVCRLRADADGTLRCRVWVTGGIALVGQVRASANLGQARAVRAADAPNRIDVAWTRPRRETRGVTHLDWRGGERRVPRRPNRRRTDR